MTAVSLDGGSTDAIVRTVQTKQFDVMCKRAPTRLEFYGVRQSSENCRVCDRLSLHVGVNTASR